MLPDSVCYDLNRTLVGMDDNLGDLTAGFIGQYDDLAVVDSGAYQPLQFNVELIDGHALSVALPRLRGNGGNAQCGGFTAGLFISPYRASTPESLQRTNPASSLGVCWIALPDSFAPESGPLDESCGPQPTGDISPAAYLTAPATTRNCIAGPSHRIPAYYVTREPASFILDLPGLAAQRLPGSPVAADKSLFQRNKPGQQSRLSAGPRSLRQQSREYAGRGLLLFLSQSSKGSTNIVMPYALRDAFASCDSSSLKKVSKLRQPDSNRRPEGYEPPALPLRHAANTVYHNSRFPQSRIICGRVLLLETDAFVVWVFIGTDLAGCGQPCMDLAGFLAKLRFGQEMGFPKPAVEVGEISQISNCATAINAMAQQHFVSIHLAWLSNSILILAHNNSERGLPQTNRTKGKG
jgi:hypothetical protein